MNNSSEVALLAQQIVEFTHSLLGEGEASPHVKRVVTMAMFVALYSVVMDDEVWDNRHELFAAFGLSKWPSQTEARERINALLDGINLRSDFWTTN